MKNTGQLQIDLTKEYGVVLEGGGAKGAYQIGVWKALKEQGVKIKGVAGVSVGALNGALICMGDLKKAEDIWQNISYSQIMQIDDQEAEALVNRELKNLNLTSVTKNSLKMIAERGVDVTPLRQLLEENIEEEKIQNSPVQFLLGTLNLSELRGIQIDAKDLKEGELKEYLLASASFPGFKREKLQGKSYLDGGMVNNVPVDMLVDRGYKDILVIRIYGIGVERKIKLPEDVNVIEIAPRVDLGSIMEFSKQKAKRNMKIGYYDAMRVLRGLQGKIYYLEDGESEEAYALKFLKMHDSVKMAWMEYMKEDLEQKDLYTRRFFESVLPQIAEKLGLGKQWTYQELYLSMLELAAKSVRVMKYKIYTEAEFVREIQKKYDKITGKEENKDLFIELIRKSIIAGENTNMY